ncbi:MAG TPA: vWA domain-containing protein [Labilithrix sp.]|nr:vWA domain-containing protein [Labilithrix sp.]
MSRTGALKMAFGTSMVLVAAAFAGCGSSSDPTFSDGRLHGENGSSGSFGPADEGDGDGNGTSSGNNTSGGVGEVSNVDPSSACATANNGAVLQPISLVIMIDRSGSMKHDGTQSTQSTRWNPVKSGLNAFFADEKLSNVSASLAFFPVNDQDGNAICTPSTYETPVVGMTDLPNPKAFGAAFSEGPAGGTPTEPALEGAIAHAKSIKTSGKNVAVILATDGEPQDCDSDTEGVKTIAANGVKAGVRTYVIGVGPSTGNLNGLAESGGTSTAIMIPTSDAAQVSADLQTAIDKIARSLLGCHFGLPTPPAGQTLDVNAVNVNYTPPDGTLKTLAYSANCANTNGWHYDSTSAPKQIILCSAACETAQAQLGAKLDIVFGCTTAVPPGGVDPNGNVR